MAVTVLTKRLHKVNDWEQLCALLYVRRGPTCSPSECADSVLFLHAISQWAAKRAYESIACRDLGAGYASIDEAYAALDTLYGRRQSHDLDVRNQPEVEAIKADPGSAWSEILLPCRVLVHFVLVILCLPLIATYPRLRALMLDQQAELQGGRLRLSVAQEEQAAADMALTGRQCLWRSLGCNKHRIGTAVDEVVAERFRIETLKAERVQALRRSVARSAVEFQHRFGVPASTITNWEQGRRKPDPAASLLLRLIEADPDLVERVAHRT